MKKRYVELVSFCVLPNHFHLIVKELDDSGISRYMQKALNSYTKYHNTKYGTSGHIFQGPYQTVHIEDDRQLLYLSAYVHKNPTNWKNYNWSSYRDFIGKNRWGKLLRNGIIVDQFDEGAYEQFVNTSVAKEPKEDYGVEC